MRRDDPVGDFVRGTSEDVIDQVREEAARCCEETAKWERGERGPLRNPLEHGILAEFSDAAFGVAGEVAGVVAEAMQKAHKRAGRRIPFTAAIGWETAATLLRKGWKRGHRLEPLLVGDKDSAS